MIYKFCQQNNMQRYRIPLPLICCLSLLLTPFFTAHCQTTNNEATQELLRQKERERTLRDQLEALPQIHFPRISPILAERLEEETPCFLIKHIQLTGEEATRFLWALTAADPVNDPATGRCLGTNGINTVMMRIQNAIIARGFITTRILAAPQDLTAETLILTIIPGRIRQIRFADGISTLASAWNAVPAKSGDLLNLRDIEQALENFKRIPTVEADIQITPAEGNNAQPGESDLVITWQQRVPPFRFHAGLDDAGSKTTGRLQGNITLSLDNYLIWNDLFYLNINHDLFNGNNKGTHGYTTHYSLPYGYWMLAATVSGYKYHQAVAGFSQNYVYSGNSNNIELRLSRVIYRNAIRKITLYGRGWARRSHAFIDDTEIQLQRRRTGGWELGLTHREYLGASTLDAGLIYKRGTGAFKAIDAPEEVLGEGTSRMRIINANAQWIMPFNLSTQSLHYRGHWRAQWNRSALVAQDRFAIGGRYSVRGFDGELTLMGERGWTLRNELGLGMGLAQELYLAIDYGYVGGLSPYHLLGHHLAGAVLGLRGNKYGFSWETFIGSAISKPQGFKTDSLTSGFQVSATY